jgi:hypothetical protein
VTACALGLGHLDRRIDHTLDVRGDGHAPRTRARLFRRRSVVGLSVRALGRRQQRIGGTRLKRCAAQFEHELPQLLLRQPLALASVQSRGQLLDLKPEPLILGGDAVALAE